MPKFSIITPQYNSYNLMGRYFETLKNQCFKDFEVIIIDDCSTDGSFEKLQKYANESPLNIVLLKTEKNSGPGNARNMGLDAAKGEWITFVDNDDWVVPNFLEIADEIIERENVNCLIYDYYTYRDGKTGVAKSMYVNEPGNKSVSDCMIAVRNHTFGKFYKFSECKTIRFPEIRRCEDVAYVCQAIAACGNAYYLNEPLYYYLQRSTSLSNNAKLDETDMVEAFAVLEEKFGHVYPKELKEKSVCDLLYGGVLMMCKRGKSATEIKNYINNYQARYKEWWKCEIINHIGLFKKAFLMLVKFQSVLGLKLLANIHSRMIK